MLIKWVLVGACVAVLAAALAYVGGPIADAGLAVLAVVVAFALTVRHDRQMSGLRKRNDRLRASVKQIHAENAALKVQLAKARAALDHKIVIAVQRLKETFRAELGDPAAARRDAEVESGLEALNRYTALATRPENLLGDDDSSHHHTAT